MEPKTPQTLMEAVAFFSDPVNAFEYIRAIRWPNGVACPVCGTVGPTLLKTRLIFKCNACKKQFSVKVGTIFEDSPLPLGKWLCASWMIANCKNGVSSYEIHRALKVTQKTAWFMLQRIRLAMRTGSFEKLKGTVEADETFVGGKWKNRPGTRPGQKARGPKGKAVVLGMLQRDGEVRTWVIDTPYGIDIRPLVVDNVERGSNLYTDKNGAYIPLGRFYTHESVNHLNEWVRGQVHTNGIESYWALLKRSIKGTYVSVDHCHLFRYCDEQAFRFNLRKENDGTRFQTVMSQVSGKRLTYAELTGKRIQA